MLIQRFSSDLIGFTSFRECDNCNNKRHFYILQDKVKNEILIIPAGTRYGVVKFQCPVCEKYEKVKSNSMYSQKYDKTKLPEEMMSGIGATAKWVKQISAKNRELLFARYNKMGLSELVVYLNNHSS